MEYTTPVPRRLFAGGPSGSLWVALALMTVTLPGCRAVTDEIPADLIIRSARVWTGVEEAPWAEAVAVTEGRIVAVGSNEDTSPFVGDETRILNLPGTFVAPGFIDNHTHFNRAGELILGINLLEVSDADGLVAEVEATAARLPDGAWMVGGMWGAYEQWAQNSTGQDEGPSTSQELFRPDRSLIDSVSPDTPALLWNWDRSQVLANGAALSAGGANCTWAGVECEDGAMTGRVSGEAVVRLRGAIPDKSMEQRLAEGRAALGRLAQNGVTTFFDITPPGQVDVYHRLRASGDLTARVNMRLVLDTWDEMRDSGITDGFGDDWIKYQGLKGFVDGIMGSSAARFYEPYVTTGVRGRWRDPTNTGYVTDDGSGYLPVGNMRRLVMGADSAGFNTRVHAIGDEAIDRILDIYQEVITTNPPRPDRRFAIIHTQVIRGPETAARMAEMNVIAEMQPYHTIDDMRWMEERIGDRSRWAYAFKTLQDAGVVLSFGSDWPGTNASWYTSSPMMGIYAAVTRQTLDGEPAGGWFPEERIDVETALRAYTVNNAYAAGDEDTKGTLEVGKFGDLVVLDANPFDVAPETLKDVGVLYTVVNGALVHEPGG